MKVTATSFKTASAPARVCDPERSSLKTKLVVVPSVHTPIAGSPGFQKKLLADAHLELCGLCEHGCRYCSSNAGNYLRIRREPFADLTEQQLGVRSYPADDPALMFMYPDVVQKLAKQLQNKPKTCGAGKTLVVSMLTDAFTPTLLQNGTTATALRLIAEKTSFHVRILTKGAAAGSSKWIDFFQEFPGRFVVGLSTGTDDDEWARRIEVKTSPPSARLRALARLQDAGVPTYGMLCPVFPHMLVDTRLEVETIVEKRGVSIALGAIVEGSGRRCASRRSARARAGADGEVLGGVGEFSASRDLLIAAA